MNAFLVIGAGIALGACGGALWFWETRQPAGSNNERRNWAKTQGYSYARKDQQLARDWAFARAQTSHAQTGRDQTSRVARDVVSGTVRGVDFSIASFGEDTLVGIRRGAGSNVAVQAIRANALDSIESKLDRVLYTSGFAVVSNDVDAAERFVDERVDAALEALDAADYVWIEDDWVVARVEDEIASLQPLTLLSDAARALPPAEFEVLDFSDADATRALPDPLDLDAAEIHEEPAAEEPPAETPPVLKPAPKPKPAPEEEAEVITYAPMFEPELPKQQVDLPSRSVAESRGQLPAHMVGGDAVDSIGDRGYTPAEEDYISPRVARDLSQGSSIFDDLSDELGITVDGKNKGDKDV